MSINHLIERLKQAGVKLQLADGKFSVGLPKNIKAELKAELIANKEALKAHLLTSLANASSGNARQNPITARDPNHSQALRLSFAQQRLWFIHQLDGGSSQYNMPAAYSVDGPFNVDAAQTALNRIVSRHEVLRTVFIETKGDSEGDSDVIQQVLADGQFRFDIHDLSAMDEAAQQYQLQKLMKADADYQFDLASELMIRASYIDLALAPEARGVLLINMHHIASDGWSMSVLLKEFIHQYEAAVKGLPDPLAPLAIQYADYALWQRNWLQGEVLDAQLNYWKQQLAEIEPVHRLVLQQPRGPVKNYIGKQLKSQMVGEVGTRLLQLAKSLNLTPFMLIHGALALFLSRHSNSHDIVIGTPVANRMQAELAPMIGFFINTLVLRVDTSASNLVDYFAHVRQVNLQGQANQDVPFEQLVQMLNVPRTAAVTPLFQIMLSTVGDYGLNDNSVVGSGEVAEASQMDFSGLQVNRLTAQTVPAKFDLDIVASVDEQGVTLNWLYDKQLFSEETISQFNQNFEQLLMALAEVRLSDRPKTAELALLSPAQRDYLTHTLNHRGQSSDQSRHRDYLRQQSIADLFEVQVSSNPTAVALVVGDQYFSYQQLNGLANQLAHQLIALGVGNETLVGICVSRHATMVIGILAIIKAGGGYVPIDSDYPQARLNYLFSDTEVKHLLGSQAQFDTFKTTGTLDVAGGPIALIDLNASVVSFSAANPQRKAGEYPGDGLAYVMYTSGSSGLPKGVMIEHHNVVRLVHQCQFMPLNSDTRFLQAAPMTFDAATLELWGPLLNGGCCILYTSAMMDLAQLNDLIVQQNINAMWLTAGLFEQWSEYSVQPSGEEKRDLPSLRHVLAGGDVLSPEAVARVLAEHPQVTVINGYGPTENTTFTCCHSMVSGTTFATSVPIGQPIQQTSVYVLDPQQQLVPFGAVGELYTGGEGVARGYLNNPQLSDSSFIVNPFSGIEGDRLYRTGDLVRYLHDEQLSFIGRVDNQVKIRGFRIEPSEIEQQLLLSEQVSGALVLVREDHNAGKAVTKTLVAYVLSTLESIDQHQQLIIELKQQLSNSLASYMQPEAIMVLAQWPLTANGKIDRKALPEPDLTASQEILVLPQNEMEQKLLQIWANLLNLSAQKISTTANFFDLGGHSLLCIRLVGAIRQQLQFELSVAQVFGAATIAAQASLVATAQASGQAVQLRQSVTVATREGDGSLMPLSFAQQRLWFIDQFNGASAQYNIPLSYRVKGDFDCRAAQWALSQIVTRHEVLRTVYVDTQDGAVQQINADFSLTIDIIDLTAQGGDKTSLLADLIAADAQKPFDLRHDLMVRASYVQLAEQEGVLLFNMHHIASDGWSMSVLVREFIAFYRAFHAASERAGEMGDVLEPLALQYSDYAYWQRQWLQGDTLNGQISYWQQQLADIPPVHSLPLDKPRPENKQTQGAKVAGKIGVEVSKTLQALARAHNMTPFMLLHGALALVLSRHSNSTDIVIGTPVANRLQSEIEPLIGFFVNTLVLRLSTNQATLNDYLNHTRQVHLDGQNHQDVPFEQLVDALNVPRSAAYSPLFQVMLSTTTNYGLSGITGEDDSQGLPGAELRAMPPGELAAKFDLELHGEFSEAGLLLHWLYDTHLFSHSHIEQLNDHLCRLLLSIAQASDATPLSELQMLSGDEIDYLLNTLHPAVAEPEQQVLLHQLFEVHAVQQPDAIAVVYEQQQLSYQQLNQQANQLAHYLQQQGVVPGTLVGVCIERSLEMLVAIFAVLKAGGGYVPLDPNYPSARLNYMLADCGLKHLVTFNASADALTLADDVVVTDMGHRQVLASVASFSTENLQHDVAVQRQHLAYVIYTSGSTGQPKGVMVQNGIAADHMQTVIATLGLTSEDRVLEFASFSFDIFVENTFATLNAGATLCLNGQSLPDSENFFKLVNAQQITLFEPSPGYLAQLLNDSTAADWANSPLTQGIVGGEALSSQLVKNWFDKVDTDKCVLYNCYGPTEAIVTTTIHALRPQDSQAVPIGKVYGRRQLLVLDHQQQLCPYGVEGELYIGGVELAAGYLGRAELTAEKFIANPFSPVAGSRMYRSGDVVRYIEDGSLLFLRRIDDQVKLRGFRIELGEIEQVISNFNQTSSVVVLLREDVPGQKRLVAYVQAKAVDKAANHKVALDNDQWLAELARLSRQTLPAHMVPSVFIAVTQWPVTPNGKLDKKALAIPDVNAGLADYQPPQNQTEQTLVEVWAGLLKLDHHKLSVNANFFELGGDSILSIQVVSRAAQQGLHFSVKDLFAAQSISQLALLAKVGVQVEAPQQPATGVVSLLPIQADFFADTVDMHHYNQAIVLNTPAAFSAEALKAMVAQLIKRHDVLRLKFVEVDGQYQGQHVAFDPSMLDFSVTHIHGLQHFDAEVAAAQCGLDPCDGRLLKALYFSDDEQPGRLLLVIHHLVVDGVSWRILLADLEILYQQWQGQKPLVLAAKTSSYQQWSRFLSEYAQSESLANERQSWLDAYALPVETLAASQANISALADREDGAVDRQKGLVKFSLSTEVTEQLLTQGNRAYRCHINELLLAALLVANQRFSGASTLRIDLEGHGREMLTDTLDLSQTVGWFTTLYPLTLSLKDLSLDHLRQETPPLGDILSAVKDQYRSIVNNGIGFGLLKSLVADADFVDLPDSELLFNYLGQLDVSAGGQKVSDNSNGSHFSIAPYSAGVSISAARAQQHPLVLTGMVNQGCLSFNLSFEQDDYSQTSMGQWLDGYAQALSDIAAHCSETVRGQYTPSDFALANINPVQLYQWQDGQDIEDLYPASGMQQGLLFQSLLDSGSYVSQMMITLAELDVAVFRQAWDLVVARHAIFRTAFVGLDGNNAHQLVRPTVQLPWLIEDFSELSQSYRESLTEQLRTADAQQGFDPLKAPLMRMTLIKYSDDSHKLVWSHHHALLDGWCVPIVFAEVSECYRALLAKQTPQLAHVPPYRGYAAWLAKQDQGATEQYWRTKLANVEAPTPLPLAGFELQAEQHGVYKHHLVFDEDQTAQLSALAKSTRVTMNVLVQAAWSLLLFRYSADPQVVFGVVISGRPAQLPGVEKMVGLFINTLPVVVNVDEQLTLEQWLQQLHTQLIEWDSYSHMPLLDIQRLAPTRQGLFDVLMAFENFPVDEAVKSNAQPAASATAASERLNVVDVDAEEGTEYALNLVAHLSNTLTVRFEADQKVLSAESVKQLSQQLQQLMLAMTDDAVQQPLSALPMLSAEQNAGLMAQIEANRVAFADDIQIHQLFEIQAAKTPDNIALVCEGLDCEPQQLSYHQLNRAANQLAGLLREQGVGRETLVAICTERTVSHMVAILAVLKAGGAYLPLDSTIPVARLNYILEDAQIAYLISQQGLVDVDVIGQSVQILMLDDPRLQQQLEQHSSFNLVPLASQKPTNLAYVIYTSGSTGQPKGVMNEHRGLCNLAQFQANRFGLTERDRVMNVSSFGFDATVKDWVTALTCGGQLHVISRETALNPDKLADYVDQHQLSYGLITPALLNVLDSQRFKSLIYLLIGGEASVLENLLPWTHGRQLLNAYGPTENTVYATIGAVKANTKVLTIGASIANVSCFVVDPQGRLLPVGAVGELWLGGVGVARGYINRDDLNQNVFIEHRFAGAGHVNQRLYRTGDLVRWHSNGELGFVGRIDEQVKIRGFRIELGEIEQGLTALDSVASALVLVNENETGHKSLIAYVIANVYSDDAEQQQVLSGELSAQLAQQLPDYMVPNHYVYLSEWPLTSNGKIDKKALPTAALTINVNDYVAPTNPLEETLIEVWSKALSRPKGQIGIHHNFFELGGDSILSIQVVSGAAQQGLHFSVKDLFEAQTISRLALKAQAAAQVEAPQGPASGEAILLPIQRKFFKDETDLHHFNQSVLLNVPLDFNLDALNAIIGALYQRHDALRLKFYRDDQGWHSEHLPWTEELLTNTVSSVLIGGEAQDFATELTQYATTVQTSLRPLQGQLFKAVLIEDSRGAAARLLLVIHHLVVDGVSWRILLQDIERLYQQFTAHKATPLTLAAKTSSLQQWGAFLHQYAQSDTLAAERDYWLDGFTTQVGYLRDTAANTDGSGDFGSGFKVATFTLSTALTEQLISQSNQAYRTQISELLLAGLLLGIHNISGEVAVRIDLEGHGREGLSNTLDLNQTVGWFTSMFPVTLKGVCVEYPPNSDEAVANLISAIKESYRQIPNKGIGFGIFKTMVNDADFAELPDSEMLFNYLGQFDQVMSQQSLFSAAAESTGAEGSFARVPSHLMQMNGMVSGGVLNFTLGYDNRVYRDTLMQGLMDAVAEGITRIIEHCVATPRGRYTPCDFPQAKMSAQELAAWSGDDEVANLYPATSMQQGLLFHSMMHSGSYVTQTVIRFDDLNVAAFRQAWQQVIDRHEIFRTAFVGLQTSNTHQLVYPTVSLPWQFEDVSALNEQAAQVMLETLRINAKTAGFKVDVAPLMSMTLVKLNQTSSQLIWSHHHALLDGWSVPIVFKEVVACYRAIRRNQPNRLSAPQPYSEYVTWLAAQSHQEAIDYWQQQLANFEQATPLPLAGFAVNDMVTVDKVDDHNSDVNRLMHHHQLELTREQSQTLSQLAQTAQTTINVIVQAAWSLLLSRYSAQPQVIFGAVSSGRPAQLPGVEQMVGLFINTLPVVINIDNDISVLDWLTQIHQQLVERDSYSHVPYQQIQRLANASEGLFDSLLVFENFPVDDAIKDQPNEDHQSTDNDEVLLKVTGVDAYEGTNYPLSLIAHFGQTLSVKFDAEQRRWSNDAMTQLVGHFKQILLSICAAPEQLLSEIELLSVEQRDYVLNQLNQTAVDYPDQQCVHQMFEHYAELMPEHTAVVFDHPELGEQTLSYSELNRKANQLADCLINEHQIKPDSLVGICAERSLQMVIAIIATLKAGGAYVPLDPDYPKARLEYVINDAQMNVVLSQGHLLAQLNGEFDLAQAKVVDLDGVNWDQYATQNPERDVLGLNQHHLAYVIYTSGSTGNPKGVLIEHQALHNRIDWMDRQFGCTAEDKILQKTPFGFDVSVWEFIWPLCRGGQLIVAKPGGHKDPLYLSDLIERQNVTKLHFVPSMLAAMLEQGDLSRCGSLQQVFCSGEALALAHVRTFAALTDSVELHNLYGPTEAAIDVSHWDCANITNATVPIGKPIQNIQLLILDPQLRLVPPGASGELHIGGDGLARGYLNLPQMTAERFIDNPFYGISNNNKPGNSRRLYKTGDLVRYLPDGNIDFIGRMDDQVKIRGLRIELAEISHQLGELAQVDSALVLAKTDINSKGEQYLVAYVKSLGHVEQSDQYIEQIQSQLALLLPDYMVPAIFVLMDNWPVTTHGKIDRKALPDPDVSHRPIIEPATDTERALVLIWQQILHLPAVSVTASFFELGGHSLLATKVVSAIEQSLAVEVQIRTLFENKTVRTLAAAVDLRLEAQALALQLAAQQALEDDLLFDAADEEEFEEL